MNSLAKQVTLKELIAGKEVFVNGDGWNSEVTLSASIVDNKPLIFASYYVLDGSGVRKYMELSESFKTLKAAKESLAA